MFERELLISVLKLTKNCAALQEDIKTDAHLPSAATLTLLKKLQNENLVYLNGAKVEVDAESRLKIAVKAIELGGDIQRISDCLDWQEFESMAATALELNGYSAKNNVRFKHDGKRWEIDVVGCRKPLVLCVDCKHWHGGMHPASIAKVASLQSKRAEALADALPSSSLDFECAKWSRAEFVPVVLSLMSFSPKYVSGIPVVPVLQLQDFVSQLPLNLECVRSFSRVFRQL